MRAYLNHQTFQQLSNDVEKMKIFLVFLTLAFSSTLAIILSNVYLEVNYSDVSREKDIDRMAERDFLKSADNSYVPYLGIDLNIPENPNVEIWNSSNSHPQQMFKFDNDYYISNMDGSNIRALIFGFELPSLRLSNPGILRSNDGRYVYLSDRGVCRTFDLFTRQVIDTGLCGAFIASTNKVYSYKKNSSYSILMTDLATGEQENMVGKPNFDTVEISDDKAFEPTTSFYVDAVNNYLYWGFVIRDASRVGKYFFSDKNYDHVVAKFMLPSMEYLSDNNKDPLLIRAACLNNYISNAFPNCNRKKLKIPQKITTKNDEWFNITNDLYLNLDSDNGSSRYIYDDKYRIKYIYRVVEASTESDSHGYDYVSTNLYLPSNDFFDSSAIDYASYLPRYITEQEYLDSYYRVREKLRISCSRYPVAYQNCEREYVMDRIFASNAQANEYHRKQKNIK